MGTNCFSAIVQGRQCTQRYMVFRFQRSLLRRLNRFLQVHCCNKFNSQRTISLDCKQHSQYVSQHYVTMEPRLHFSISISWQRSLYSNCVFGKHNSKRMENIKYFYILSIFVLQSKNFLERTFSVRKNQTFFRLSRIFFSLHDQNVIE